MSADRMLLAAEGLRHRAGCPGPNYAVLMGNRGDKLLTCRGCQSTAPLHRLLEPADEQTARYVLACVRCDNTIRLHRARPRVPLCARCKRRSTPEPDHDTRSNYR